MEAALSGLHLHGGAKSLQEMLCYAMQGDLLSRLQEVNHVIRLLGKGTCEYAGKEWHCVIVSPYCQPLTCDDSVELFAQVSTTSSQQYAETLKLGVFLCFKCRSCCMPMHDTGLFRFYPSLDTDGMVSTHSSCRSWVVWV